MEEEEEETLLDVQHSPLFKLKRKVLIMALFFHYFLGGLEYSITIPASYLNGRYSSADRMFMILEVGLYPLASMVTALLLGHIYDRTKKIRRHLIVLDFLQIIGNFMYAVNYSKWFPLLGRVVSGFGDGFIALSVAEITYLYEEHDRVGMLCFLELGRVLGFMMGPNVNYFIVEWTTRHQWTLHYKSLPSYVMGCFWMAMLLITLCCVHNLALEVIEKFNLNDSPFLTKRTLFYDEDADDCEDVEKETEEICEEGESVNESDDDVLLGPDYGEIVEEDKKDEFEQKADDIFPIPEEKPKLTRRERLRLYTRSKISLYKQAMSNNANEVFRKSHLSEIFHIEFGLLMLVNFLFWYSQTSFVMFCAYVTTFEYKWEPIEIGFVYVIGFVLIASMFIIMYFVRQSLAKRNIYFVILSMAFIQLSLGLLIYESVPKGINKRIIVFVFSALLLFTSIPLSMVCFKTLLTSLVRPGIQGTLQGLSSAIARLAMLSGLLLSIVTCDHRQVYASVMTVFSFVTIIFFFLTFDRIVRRQKESTMRLSF